MLSARLAGVSGLGQGWTFAETDAGVQNSLGQLLDEKRYSVGVRDNPVDHLLSWNSSLGHGIDQRRQPRDGEVRSTFEP